jgi:hypothetical protein
MRFIYESRRDDTMRNPGLVHGLFFLRILLSAANAENAPVLKFYGQPPALSVHKTSRICRL